MTGPLILVVDDVAENRALARATCEDEGFRVIEATDGATGILAFEQSRPTAIVMDVRMPGIDGLEACRRIRTLPGGQDVAIVFATAQRELETFEHAIAAGGDEFLTKPLRPDELVSRLQSAMHSRHLVGERRGLYDDLKQQRDQLLRVQYQKEQLAAYVVHDLKNPVSSIDLQAQRVLRDPLASARSRDAATAIRSETRTLMRMLTNLLDVSKADDGELTVNRTDANLAALVSGVVDELQNAASDAEVRIVTIVDVARASIDIDLVQRVIANLADNALRHAPAGSEVTIALALRGTALELRVRDRGQGIAPDRRAGVFDRFVTTERAQGHHRGLGLAFCKLAVEAHGGEISIEDAGPGAVFCATLPQPVVA